MEEARNILPRFGLPQVHAAVPDGLVMGGRHLIADGLKLLDAGRIQRRAVPPLPLCDLLFGQLLAGSITGRELILRVKAGLHTSFSDGELIVVRIGGRRLTFLADKIEQQVRDFLGVLRVAAAHGIRADLRRKGPLFIGDRQHRRLDPQRLALPQEVDAELAVLQKGKGHAAGKSIPDLRGVRIIEQPPGEVVGDVPGAKHLLQFQRAAHGRRIQLHPVRLIVQDRLRQNAQRVDAGDHQNRLLFVDAQQLGQQGVHGAHGALQVKAACIQHIGGADHQRDRKTEGQNILPPLPLTGVQHSGVKVLFSGQALPRPLAGDEAAFFNVCRSYKQR